MAATVARDSRLSQGSSQRVFSARGGQIEFGTITFDDSYPTGGESVSFGFTPAVVIVAPAGGFVFEYVISTGKVKAYYADYDAVADGALIEVANAASGLDAISAQYIAFG